MHANAILKKGFTFLEVIRIFAIIQENGIATTIYPKIEWQFHGKQSKNLI
jgi:hypothetical protein